MVERGDTTYFSYDSWIQGGVLLSVIGFQCIKDKEDGWPWKDDSGNGAELCVKQVKENMARLAQRTNMG
ncbi:hypothetical protein L1987_22466 [Smallanthus sonchifolius]|uniref:Uncharacterized protein n=1 Tax=Smallanthus sonchifolius TaxID=185202 RepID=A0ACB9IER4_9ASTR|nr:hypothetical protein L1987_22466 [Smallanthus sonchifolius]